MFRRDAFYIFALITTPPVLNSKSRCLQTVVLADPTNRYHEQLKMVKKFHRSQL